MLHTLTELDYSIFKIINLGYHNYFLDGITRLISLFGGGEFLFPAAIVLFFLKKKGARSFGILLFISLFISYGIVFVLKAWIARLRPEFIFPAVHALVHERGFSFPSGHTTNAFMTATLLSRYIKRFYFFYIIAVTIGFSRIYLGVHFPSDVVAGAVIGTFLGYSILRVTTYAEIKKGGRDV